MSVSEESPLTPDSNSNGPSGPIVSDLLAQMQRVDGWHELESDPGLFNALISDFGCEGVAVEEIYELGEPFRTRCPTVYGYIFLYNVIEERRGRRAPSTVQSGEYIRDEDFIKKIFFAYQKVQNSCASHAIISILLNVKNLNLGPILTRLKVETKDMCPEDKGYAIGNIKEIAQAHNQRAQMDLSGGRNSNVVRISQRSTTAAEAFHFVCFLPIDGRLIELDGLKEFPIDHGEFKDEDWTDKLQRLVSVRMHATHDDHDIRYSLMAVIPDPCKVLQKNIDRCKKVQSDMFDVLTHITPICKAHYYQTRHSDVYQKLKNHPEMKKNFTFESINSELNTENDSLTYIMNWNGIEIPKKISDSDSVTLSVSGASDYQFEDENDSEIENQQARHFFCRMLNDQKEPESMLSSPEEEKNANKTVIECKMKRIINEIERLSNENDKKSHLMYHVFQEIQRIIPNIEIDLKKFCNSLSHFRQTRKTEILDVERRVHNMDEFITTFVGLMSYANLLQELPDFCDFPLNEINENGKISNDQDSSSDKKNKKLKIDSNTNNDCSVLKSAIGKAEILLDEIECSRLATPNIDLSQWKN